MGTSSLCLYCILLIVLIEGEGNREGYSASKSNAWPERQYFKKQLEPYNVSEGHGQIGRLVQSIEQHPYMAFLYRQTLVKLSDGSHRYAYEKCGATILTTKNLLTAAQCLTQCSIVDEENLKPGDYVHTICKKYVIEDFLVFAGSTIPDYAKQVKRVKNIFIHPHYEVYDRKKKCKGNNDIAIVELKTALTFTNEISFVILPPPDFKNTVHMKCYVLGWGGDKNKFGLRDLYLQITNVKYINNRRCINHIKHLIEHQLPVKQRKFIRSFYRDYTFCKDTKHCSLVKRKGTCLGDSGVPIMCNGVQIGVMSPIFFKNNKKSCVGWHLPHVYTRVDKYLNWINKIIS